jgi:hypothetical protein
VDGSGRGEDDASGTTAPVAAAKDSALAVEAPASSAGNEVAVPLTPNSRSSPPQLTLSTPRQQNPPWGSQSETPSLQRGQEALDAAHAPQQPAAQAEDTIASLGYAFREFAYRVEARFEAEAKNFREFMTMVTRRLDALEARPTAGSL